MTKKSIIKKQRKSNDPYLMNYPNLHTFLMVERFIHRHSSEFKVKELWRNLPEKINYKIYLEILDYLVYVGKIAIPKGGLVIWIYNPRLVKKLKKLGREV